MRVSVWSRLRALLGISAYEAASTSALALTSGSVESIRRMHGGQLQPLPSTRTRWYLEDIEDAERAADCGDLTTAAQLMRSARRDGIFGGVLSTRTDGLVRLPRRVRGLPDAVAALESQTIESRPVFDELCPSAELASMTADGMLLGVAVAELVPVEGRDYPVLVRLDPEFLSYRWTENRWYFRSVAGLIPITPGDGRWVLHVPGGRVAPWQSGLWRAIARAYVRKEHASMYRDAWESKLANPARVAIAPAGATEAQKQSWFRRVMQWGVNSVFGMSPGYDVKLLESNGRGADSFRATIAEQNNEMIIAVAGQTVTTDGGTGFANADVHKSIRADLIKSTADALAYTINTQVLPSWLAERYGEEALDVGVRVEWDVTPPKDRLVEANAYAVAAGAMKALTEALAVHGRSLDVSAFASQFGIPTAAVLSAMTEEQSGIVPIGVAA